MRVRPHAPYTEVCFTLPNFIQQRLVAVSKTLPRNSHIPKVFTTAFTVPILRAPLKPTTPWGDLLNQTRRQLGATYAHFQTDNIERHGHCLTMTLRPKSTDSTIALFVAEQYRNYLAREKIPPAHHFGPLTDEHHKILHVYGDPDTATMWRPRIPLAICTSDVNVPHTTRSALNSMESIIPVLGIAALVRNPIGDVTAVLHHTPMNRAALSLTDASNSQLRAS